MTNVPNVTLNDGTSIPQVGLGVFQVSNEAARDAVQSALSVGYRSIDTAAIYGNEAGVGDGLRASSVPRDDVYVTTKLWNDAHGYDSALVAFETSRARLGLDVVDLYLIHWPCPRQDRYVESWRALVSLRDQGWVRSIGVSNFTADDLRRLVDETGVVPAVNQVELHPRLQQGELRGVHAELGVATEAWSPLAQARLLDDPLLGEIASVYGVTSAQVILRWHLQLGNVIIPKSVTPSRIAANIDLFRFELTDEDMQAIAGLNRDARIGPDPREFG
jgi:2,5-diketo-D-gluconate reductase A